MRKKKEEIFLCECVWGKKSLIHYFIYFFIWYIIKLFSARVEVVLFFLCVTFVLWVIFLGEKCTIEFNGFNLAFSFFFLPPLFSAWNLIILLWSYIELLLFVCLFVDAKYRYIYILPYSLKAAAAIQLSRRLESSAYF